MPFANKFVRPTIPLAKLTEGTAASKAKMTFPSDLGQTGHHVQFDVFSRAAGSTLASVRGNKSQLDKLLSTIYLPMPANLGVQYSADYQNEDLGLIGAAAVEGATNLLETGSDVFKKLGTAVGNLVKGEVSGASTASLDAVRVIGSAASKTVDNLISEGGTGAAAAVGAIAAKVGGTAKATVANVTGAAPNPHRVVLFQGVQYREHQFQYRLSPKSSAETQTITRIINNLKYYMHPEFGGGGGGITARAFLSYPELFRIKFKNDTHLFQTLPCVLKSLQVQYHPMGYPAYIRADGDIAPVEVDIQMSFQETEIITKDFIKGENFTSEIQNPQYQREAETEPF